MSIAIHPEFESRLRALAAAEGLSVEQYLERLIQFEEGANERLQKLALEGLNSGEPSEPDSLYWEAKHRRLDERLRNASPE